jgi:Holliday junction DNA helicase RuvA
MIGYIQGRPVRSSGDTILVLVAGIGYELHCSKNTVDSLEGKTFVELWVHTHVREDALQLFGFINERERELFLSLLKVNGIGPKSALNILSGAQSHQLLDWIENENVSALSKLPKVGKKTAEQMILTLKGKLVRAENEAPSARTTTRAQIVSALVNLGFRGTEVEKVVDQMKPDTDLETGLRQGLAALTT